MNLIITRAGRFELAEEAADDSVGGDTCGWPDSVLRR